MCWIGTVQSVPRLMQGQGLIVGVGRLDYPATFGGSDPQTLAELGISKVMTVSSTYDHRIIQGAESGLFLKRIQELLMGEDDFYGQVFRALGVPYQMIVTVRRSFEIAGDPKFASPVSSPCSRSSHCIVSRSTGGKTNSSVNWSSITTDSSSGTTAAQPLNATTAHSPMPASASLRRRGTVLRIIAPPTPVIILTLVKTHERPITVEGCALSGAEPERSTSD